MKSLGIVFFIAVGFFSQNILATGEGGELFYKSEGTCIKEPTRDVAIFDGGFQILGFNLLGNDEDFVLTQNGSAINRGDTLSFKVFRYWDHPGGTPLPLEVKGILLDPNFHFSRVTISDGPTQTILWDGFFVATSSLKTKIPDQLPCWKFIRYLE